MLNQTVQGSRNLRIAVAGATGRVGATLIDRLGTDPVDVIALTRQNATAQFASKVAVTTVDFERPATLEEALRGVDKLFVAHGTSARQVENEISLIDAAVAAGVRHIVKLSVMGPATRLNPFAWHMQIEAHLARQPVASTALRPTTFADVLKRAGAHVAAGNWAGAAGAGSVNFIDTRDVAEAARVALLENMADQSQRAYHLSGPRNWTMPEVAQELSHLLGRPVVYNDRSPTEHRAALLADGLPPLVADLLLGLDRLVRESALAETTSTFERLTGKRPRSLSDWLRENIAVFQR
ncbi:NmrA family NAD(P)-binding protein [Paraburkholderia aromaticivorans]|uniref:NAD(P)-dependent oxidoreductase n=1 Tax=Paraburkholderia aromaticivorans TaxID=2026199 RepID=A0A248VW62_9BURK|nr:NmrA family NAD(P)-binding protein [Paraburkholderia aromaticivorans]ASW03238.1 NAD(P)-dependent oxidoreductase [Paraburkholderia aromaticivorans]